MPPFILIDFAELLYRTDPSNDQFSHQSFLQLKDTGKLHRFLNILDLCGGSKFIIERVFIFPDESQVSSDEVVWAELDNCPNILDAFEDDLDVMEMFSQFVLYVTLTAECVISAALQTAGIPADNKDYLFHQWVTHDSAMFTHRLQEVNFGS